jgi:hypothetical protein
MRLNIKKATLRHWRSEFARNLRLLGVEANATERAVRGQGMKAKKDGIYRASLRGDSTHIRAQTDAVAAGLLKENVRAERGKLKLAETRKAVEAGWRSVGRLLARDGHHHLASDVRRFADRMPIVKTEGERISDEMMLQGKAHSVRDNQLAR